MFKEFAFWNALKYITERLNKFQKSENSLKKEAKISINPWGDVIFLYILINGVYNMTLTYILIYIITFNPFDITTKSTW